ncbi:MAG TPA: mycothiol system anti-sigma-R factor [Nocardioides sp.]|jgi:mycothiol system anti-sigma-R factor|uniref:mycothiol system anti-sigma-R factor n=1 Tax=Nocardioides sp. TaxID=35761 RepID=UPI002E3295D5|nr:mycothiol system anti-sigma-R factor [Nocardioides sp.]HEX3931848.1 mycothiol system anti-sigma-R factor [Nocardioides sp.]
MSGKTDDETCANFLERIVCLLDNELDAVDVAEVKAHLDECAPCLQSYDLQRTVKALVARSCMEHAPDSLRQRVRVQIQQIRVTYTEG